MKNDKVGTAIRSCCPPTCRGVDCPAETCQEATRPAW
jgi:hypothetical protein